MSTLGRQRVDIHERLSDLLDQGAEPQEAAEMILIDLKGYDEMKDILWTLLEEKARDIQRTKTRAKEDQAFAKTSRKSKGSIDKRTIPEMLFELRDQSFWVDGEYVLWGEATEEQHLARAEQQRRLAGSIMVDVERHEACARLIRENGVNCLNEISAAA